MSQSEGIAYIKQVLEQVKVRSQAEKALKRERYEGRSQLSLPFLDEINSVIWH